MYKIAIFASGSGSNAENIATYFKDKPVAEVIKEITEHSKKVQNQFQKETKMGFDDF